ncbi:MAG: hypothetical protein QOH47_2430 [Sphingomonadales bacterium]|jgi:hypothetical protein|nr:hypothetical protein [Sphingomonadales bacterium]
MAIALPFAVIPTPLGTVTSGNELAAKPASFLGQFKAPGLTWKSSGSSSLWVRGNFGSAKPVDFVSVMQANAIAATTIRVRLGDTQAEVDGTADYDSGVLPFISPSITRTDGLYHSHLELPSVQTKQWWRIDIASHTGDFEASMLVMGQKLTPANWYNPGWARGTEDLGAIDFTRWGIADEQDGLIWRTLSFRLGWLSEADYETKFGPMEEALGKRGVVLWCFDPTSGVYRQRKTYFGRMRNALVATHARDTPAGIRYDKEFEILSMF